MTIETKVGNISQEIRFPAENFSFLKSFEQVLFDILKHKLYIRMTWNFKINKSSRTYCYREIQNFIIFLVCSYFELFSNSNLAVTIFSTISRLRMINREPKRISLTRLHCHAYFLPSKIYIQFFLLILNKCKISEQ